MSFGTSKFWSELDKLVIACPFQIERPKGSRHPKYPDFIYPVDYGFLSGTTSNDGAEVDVWQGSDPKKLVDAVICTVDMVKKDAEVKILVGCTEDEKRAIHEVMNQDMGGLLVRRNEN